MKIISKKQVGIILLGTSLVLLLVGIIIKQSGKSISFSVKSSIREPVCESDSNQYWRAVGPKWAYIVPNKETADYINSAGDSLDFIFIFNPNGTGSVVSKDKKLLLFKFHYKVYRDILVLNNGKTTQYFQKINNIIWVSHAGYGTLRLKKIE